MVLTQTEEFNGIFKWLNSCLTTYAGEKTEIEEPGWE